MNKFKLTGLILLFAIASCFSVKAQQISDLRLNEILIKNDTNFIDDYGRHVPWIEIFNTAYNTINVGGCFLTNDTTGISQISDKAVAEKLRNKWYAIPKGDPLTAIEQRSCVVFYMDANPTYGTFHVNFDPYETDYVALINSNGKDIIDIIQFPAEIRNKTVSYGCEKDGDISTRKILETFTPGSVNEISTNESKSDKLAKTDPYGISLTIMAMSVVFAVLIIIYIMLKLFAKFANKKPTKKQNIPADAPAVAEASPKEQEDELNGEEIAAITMALDLHLTSQHDQESEIITIESPSAHYSPWAQKNLIFKKSPRKN